MVRVRYQGRLGNKLFQYAFGRILAEDLGYRLIAPPIPHFVCTQDNVDGLRIDSMVTLSGHFVGLENIRPFKGKKAFSLRGYFQRYELYQEHKERIRTWFNRGFQKTSVSPGTVVLHCRRTHPIDTKYLYNYDGLSLSVGSKALVLDDDVRGHLRKLGHKRDFYANYDMLPFEWYEKILNEISFDKLIICTDVRGDPFFEHFAKYNPEISSRNVQEDFDLIRSASRIICSISTFGWWACFLSEAKEIYLPVPDYATWRNREAGVSLSVPDESRFRHRSVSQEGTFF